MFTSRILSLVLLGTVAASVNAQQGYRPNAVVKYALQLMRARVESKKAPAAPNASVAAAINTVNRVDNVNRFRRTL